MKSNLSHSKKSIKKQPYHLLETWPKWLPFENPPKEDNNCTNHYQQTNQYRNDLYPIVHIHYSPNVADQARGFFASAELALCTPGMGVNLWGVSPLCVNPINVVRRGYKH